MRHASKGSHRLQPQENYSGSILLSGLGENRLLSAPVVLGAIYDSWESSLNVITNAYNAIDDAFAATNNADAFVVTGGFCKETLQMEMEKMALVFNRIMLMADVQMDCLRRSSPIDSNGSVHYLSAVTDCNPVSAADTLTQTASSLDSYSIIFRLEQGLRRAWEHLALEALLLSQYTSEMRVAPLLAEQTKALSVELESWLQADQTDIVTEVADYLQHKEFELM